MSVVLSEDQEAARSQIHAALEGGAQVSVLVGPAGSGKTTLMRTLLDDIGQKRQVVLLCPTGKAAARLSEVTGRPAATIHRALYGRVESDGTHLTFGAARAPCLPGGLIVCDEASMVSASLHADLIGQLPTGAQLLYVGDREQLPPVRGEWGPDFTAPTAALEAIHRQAAESPIIQLAHAIRHGRSWAGWEAGLCERRVGGEPVRWLTERLTASVDATLITTTNQRRSALNAAVRAELGLDEAPLSPGDRIVNLINQDTMGLMNGEVRVVEKAHRAAGPSWMHRAELWEVVLDGETAMINVDLIGAPVPAFKKWRGRKKNLGKLLHVDYGFCLTVHKAQGSQWSDVGFVSCPAFRRLPDRRRLAYTAVTRAAERLCIFA
ncbi:MAG: ATP-dependent exoDNAse (exonuclease V) alpha subunit [Myxococcota bacterium]|jgi:ATP-dependent exoDNAse (exonuclease V) alpha subunit